VGLRLVEAHHPPPVGAALELEVRVALQLAAALWTNVEVVVDAAQVALSGESVAPVVDADLARDHVHAGPASLGGELQLVPELERGDAARVAERALLVGLHVVLVDEPVGDGAGVGPAALASEREAAEKQQRGGGEGPPAARRTAS